MAFFHIKKSKKWLLIVKKKLKIVLFFILRNNYWVKNIRGKFIYPYILKGDKIDRVCWACLFCSYYNAKRTKDLDLHSLISMLRPTFFFVGTRINIILCIFRPIRCSVRMHAPPHPHICAGWVKVLVPHP